MEESSRARTRDKFTDASPGQSYVTSVQVAQLLADGKGNEPPAASPPGSIIPALPAVPGAPNWTQFLMVQNAPLTIPAGTYLYSDQDFYMVTGDSYYHAPLVIEGTLWMDGHVAPNLHSPGVMYRAVISTDVINRGTAVVLAHDDRPRIGESSATVFFRFNKLENSGEVFAWAEYGLAFALVTDSSAEITNSGLLAASADTGVATTISLSNGAGIRNLAGGRILAEAPSATAISFYNADLPWGYTYQVENAGLIQARSTNADIASIGLSFTHASHQTIRVLNSGTITADVAIIDRSSTEGAYSPVQAAVQIITNQATGIINGDIILDRGDDQIVNSGTINGIILLGEGNDLLDTQAGTVSGLIDLFWGADIFKGSAAADYVVGGSGNDILEGNGGNDQLMGGGNDDVLIGGAGNDGLFGEYGNDRIVTQGGDFVWAGAGDDRIELGDYQFELVAGNEGFDTLVLPSEPRILDLATVLAAQALEGIEEILLNGSKEIVIRAADIPLLTGGGLALRLAGTATDKIHLIGAWSDAGSVTIDSVSYREYRLDGNSLFVQGASTVLVNGSPPAGVTGLDPFPGGGAAPIPGDGPLDFTPTASFLVNYTITESVTVNPEETWWNDLGAAVLNSSGFGFITLTNHGHIWSWGDAQSVGGPLELSAVDLLQNEGTITAQWAWQNPQNLSEMGLGGVAGTSRGQRIVNNGIIQGLAEHGGAVGAAQPDILTNHNEVRAVSLHGWAIGVMEPGVLDNQGVIRAEGAVSAVGVRFVNGDFVVASGLIEAHVTGDGFSIGAELQLLSGSAVYHFTNTATIIGDYALFQTRSAHSGDRPTEITNNGQLNGMVELGKAVDTLVNNGLIYGAVRLLDGDDTFDGAAGVQSGGIHGGLGNDRLIGGRGSEQLFGDAGNDILTGGGGHDWLEGGAGADVFVFEATADSRLTALRSDGKKIMPDVIADFLRGTDLIDLSAIDAVAGSAGNEAFSFIGAGAFTNQAGQLRAVTANGATSVYADVDGDGAADLHIMLLATPVALTAADFIL